MKGKGGKENVRGRGKGEEEARGEEMRRVGGVWGGEGKGGGGG